MTTEPETLSPTQEKMSQTSIAALEDLFSLGYRRSNLYTIYEDEATGVKIDVQYRTLFPKEIREIAELVDNFKSPIGRYYTEQMETLARAILTVNALPLILGTEDRQAFEKEHGRSPTELDMARYVLVNKLKSEHILDILYDAYQEFIKENQEHFANIKKKLKQATSSESTSQS